MSSLSDPAVQAVLRHHGQRSPGTPMRAVVSKAAALGFDVVPPREGSSATYLRLVSTTPSGRDVTLHVDGAKLTSNATGDRAFAAALPGAVETTVDVQSPSPGPTRCRSSSRSPTTRVTGQPRRLLPSP
ncbi:hypothetical protein SAMN05660657_04033 [Geodermatophilus amargosae]|uniref:Uncharacterized protein n=1 Tax=Geodermatophilus amargosae TaxID=1296565 RepID=A0A1I7C3D8_9ACTN|nr:hypothetical protein [Geodermatophilus amargosae]SFT93967.1 hypothetical protein SAMN05660657_04033 [Geodermatophilus amargosae]